jgi:hypothetical protein
MKNWIHFGGMKREGKRGQGVLLIGGGSAKPALANLVGALQSGILQRSVQWGQVLLFGNINS